jgi:hypothetical protein
MSENKLERLLAEVGYEKFQQMIDRGEVPRKGLSSEQSLGNGRSPEGLRNWPPKPNRKVKDKAPDTMKSREVEMKPEAETKTDPK